MSLAKSTNINWASSNQFYMTVKALALPVAFLGLLAG